MSTSLLTTTIAFDELFKRMKTRPYHPWLLCELADLAECSHTVLQPILWQLTRSGLIEFKLIQNGAKVQDYSWSVVKHD